MKTINLFPWRTTQRQQAWRQFFIVILSSITITSISLFLWSVLIKKNIRQINQRNMQLQQQAVKLQRQLNLFKNTTALIPQKFTGDLSIKFFNDLPYLIPRDVYLTQIKLYNNHVELIGYAATAAITLTMLSHMQQKGWQAKIKNINDNTFTIQITSSK